MPPIISFINAIDQIVTNMMELQTYKTAHPPSLGRSTNFVLQEAEMPDVDDGACRLYHVKGSSEDCCKGIEVR